MPHKFLSFQYGFSQTYNALCLDRVAEVEMSLREKKVKIVKVDFLTFTSSFRSGRKSR